MLIECRLTACSFWPASTGRGQRPIWMMSQKEFVNVQALRAAGWTIRKIADHLGYHPAAVSGWLKAGGPPPKRGGVLGRAGGQRTVGEAGRRLLSQNPQLQGTSILRVLRAEGFAGPYPTLTRHLRTVRGPSGGGPGPSTVTVRIETGPPSHGNHLPEPAWCWLRGIPSWPRLRSASPVSSRRGRPTAALARVEPIHRRVPRPPSGSRDGGGEHPPSGWVDE